MPVDSRMPVVCALVMAARVSSVTFSMLNGCLLGMRKPPALARPGAGRFRQEGGGLPPVVDLLELGDGERVQVERGLVAFRGDGRVQPLAQFADLGLVDRGAATVLP